MRRAGDTEEGRASRVRSHVKGNQRSEQRRQKDRGWNETEGWEGRNKLSTWLVDKQKPGRREWRGHNISKGRAEGSIYGRTGGKKGRATGKHW